MDKLAVAALPALQQVIPYTLAIILALAFGWVIGKDLIRRFKAAEAGAAASIALPELEKTVAKSAERLTKLEEDLREFSKERHLLATSNELRSSIKDVQDLARMAASESNNKIWDAIRAIQTELTVKDAIEKDRKERT